MKIFATLGMQTNINGTNLLQFHTQNGVQLETGHKYFVTIQDPDNKRTLNQNSLYWTIVNQVAEKVHITPVEAHNHNLETCRILWLDSNGEPIKVRLPDDDTWSKRMDLHFTPTSKAEEDNGKFYRWFLMLLPSHLMDRKEMGRLLDNIIETAEDMGIHTEPELIIKAKENSK